MDENLIIKFEENEGMISRTEKLKRAVNWLCHEMEKGRVENNTLVFQKENEEMKTPLSIAFVKMAEKGDIDEVTASENVELFVAWNELSSYAFNDLRKYNGKLYRCLQAHTGQADWTPDIATSLWKLIGINENGIPEWSQPISSADAYNTGDEVMFNGIHYRSTIDSNVWSPETYPAGWEVIENVG